MTFRPLPAVAITAAAALLVLTGCTTTPPAAAPTTAAAQVEDVAPGLARYDEEIVDQLWEREGLSARDRSLVTIAEMIAAGQTADLTDRVNQGLEHGVTPAEVSETVTHLAFYAGWPNAAAAIPHIAAAFTGNDIDPSALPDADPTLLPIDAAAEQARATQVESTFGSVSPGVVADTGEVLFQDLWLRPDLEPRDRSLVTVVALITTGQVGQIPFHLGRAMDNGLTEAEAGEVLSHLAYFTGWPKVFTAMPIVDDVFQSRPTQ